MKNRKFLTLAALVVSGAALFQNGCLGGFWKGFTNGWPQNRIANIALDIITEEILG